MILRHPHTGCLRHRLHAHKEANVDRAQARRQGRGTCGMVMRRLARVSNSLLLRGAPVLLAVRAGKEAGSAAGGTAPSAAHRRAGRLHSTSGEASTVLKPSTCMFKQHGCIARLCSSECMPADPWKVPSVLHDQPFVFLCALHRCSSLAFEHVSAYRATSSPWQPG